MLTSSFTLTGFRPCASCFVISSIVMQVATLFSGKQEVHQWVKGVTDFSTRLVKLEEADRNHMAHGKYCHKNCTLLFSQQLAHVH